MSSVDRVPNEIDAYLGQNIFRRKRRISNVEDIVVIQVQHH